MGRKRKKQQEGENQKQNVAQNSWYWRIAERIVAMPRLLRILFVGVFALMTTLALSPIVDEIYIRYFFNMETRAIPYLISTTAGLAMYLTGWQLIVGPVGDDMRVHRRTFWYLGTAILVTMMVNVWLLRLATVGHAQLF